LVHMDGNPTWYVYVLECSDGTLYTGITVDPSRRLVEHNSGRGARYTRSRLPVRLVGSVALTGHAEALRMERLVKGWPAARKRKWAETLPAQEQTPSEDADPGGPGTSAC